MLPRPWAAKPLRGLTVRSLLSAEDVFVVDASQEARKSGKVYAYFAGENVTEALGGKTFTRADGQLTVSRSAAFR